MSQITTHVLDITRGRPARNLPITLSQQADGSWETLASGKTNEDGRIADLLQADCKLAPGVYRMQFDTQAYFNANNEEGFYPYVDIVFRLDASDAHCHVPLLLSAFGYSTYRGS